MSDYDDGDAARFITSDGGWCAPVWPGAVDTHGLEEAQVLEDESSLDEDQDARVAALYYAREVLERRGGIGGSNPPQRMDLLSVANWILTGSYRVDG